MKLGQINVGSVPGDLLTNITKREDVNTIVEIGTWNGMGSTICVIKGIVESGVKKDFYSLELYTQMYHEAVSNLKSYSDYVKLINGSIITIEDMNWFDHNIINEVLDHGSDLYNISYDHTRLYFQTDLENIKNSTNVLEQLPKQIDFLILDGGEYSTYPEWKKLESITRIVALDDTNLFKCSKIREEILASNNYRTLYDNPNDRYGFSIFEKI